ncbi:MFS transporter [Kitasatospora viridis]|uniref:EmrB/QacA subfamily drug resistance transporter n=1 Tax=Kitasatospora viridis TaxID=281105 RepID=A0A561T7J8_9ACTN|nr:MFS transporter [Kitasatospora viridis]TWF83081.1 EmrB/QacA subfamily drug resistance transporter [Kitasatospora viridis]
MSPTPPPSTTRSTDADDARSEAERIERRRWQALAVCLLVGFMSLLDVSIVNVALPSIEQGLRASPADLSWVLSGYALTFGLTLIPAGVLGDFWGRRTAFLAGLALFTVASGACGLAPSATALVVSRLVQGMASGLLGPQISGLIQEMFSGAVRARAFGYFGTTVGLATAVGPLAGGLLINAAGAHDGWRWVFFVNLPIGVVAFALALKLIPTRGRAVEAVLERRIDLVGVGLLAAGLLAILLPLVQEQQWQGDTKWLLIPLGLVLLSVFVVWERRCRTPLVDLTLFRLRSYTFGTLLGLLYFAGFTTIFFIFTLYLQRGLGYTALQAGAAITPFALGSAVSAALGGRLVSRHGRLVIIVGLVTVIIGTAFAAFAVHLVPGHGAALATAAPLLVAGIGSGLVIAPNQSLALACVPVARAGTAGGILQTAQRLGTATGVACVGAVFFAHLAAHGSWAGAFQLGVLVALGFELAALVCALADFRSRRHQ